jgi:hypothetical protein
LLDLRLDNQSLFGASGDALTAVDTGKRFAMKPPACRANGFCTDGQTMTAVYAAII